MAIAPGAKAIGRSLRIYHDPRHTARLDAFHRRFLDPGGLGFDVGAHVGGRTGSFLRLGARALAVEPQPPLARLLRLLFAHNPAVTVAEVLVGAAPGKATLFLNTANPTIATASPGFIAAAAGAPGWEGERWDAQAAAQITTLDLLIAAHGMPGFIKIDVEGFEAEALSGLSRAVRSLSFEFTTIQRDVAYTCLDRLGALGYRAFNACLGESMEFAHPHPVDAAALADWIAGLPGRANSGDVYASLEPARLMP